MSECSCGHNQLDHDWWGTGPCVSCPCQSFSSVDDADSLKAQIAELKARQQEHLKLIVKLTNETPFADEVKGWLDQRAKMIAEIGTLKARIESARAALVEWRKDIDDAHLDEGWAIIEGIDRMLAAIG